MILKVKECCGRNLGLLVLRVDLEGHREVLVRVGQVLGLQNIQTVGIPEHKKKSDIPAHNIQAVEIFQYEINSQ